jgi:hypothetical protein
MPPLLRASTIWLVMFRRSSSWVAMFVLPFGWFVIEQPTKLVRTNGGRIGYLFQKGRREGRKSSRKNTRLYIDSLHGVDRGDLWVEESRTGLILHHRVESRRRLAAFLASKEQIIFSTDYPKS